MMKIFKSADRVPRMVAININNITKIIKCDHFTMIFMVDATSVEVAETFEEVIEKINS